jgi:hypothetical protein
VVAQWSRSACSEERYGLIGAHRPLVTDGGAELVSIQVLSADPMAAIEMTGKRVVPQLWSVWSAGCSAS